MEDGGELDWVTQTGESERSGETKVSNEQVIGLIEKGPDDVTHTARIVDSVHLAEKLRQNSLFNTVASQLKTCPGGG